MHPIRRHHSSPFSRSPVFVPSLLVAALVALASWTDDSAARSQAEPATAAPSAANASPGPKTIDAGTRRALSPNLLYPGLVNWVYTGSSNALDPRLRNLGSSVAGSQQVTRGPMGEEVLSVLIRGSVATSALRAMGADVQTEVGEVRTARVPVSALSALVNLPGVDHLSLGYRMKPQLDASIPDTHADDKRPQEPPLFGWYGKNVIVGIIDTGFDYHHPDFRNPDNSTRFLSIWDQNVAGTPPAGFGYGNECNQASMNPGGACSEADPDGHGSHVLGIAAGDGSATGGVDPAFQFVGMANGAQIIGVATNFTSAGVVDAANYIFLRAAAAGKPAVINMSLGTNLGPHDGQTLFEKALSGLTGPGKVLVASAGNGQTDNGHSSRNIPIANAQDTLFFNIPAYSANSGSGNDFVSIDIWHINTNAYSVTIRRPSSSTPTTAVTKGNSNTFSTTDGQILVDYTNINDPGGDGQSEIYIEINDGLGTAPRAGPWQVRLTGTATPGNPKVHAWMDSGLGNGGVISSFTTDLDTTMIVASPGTADSVIAAAATTTKEFWASIDGQIYHFTGSVAPPLIAPFSARGPRRDGAQKPDIAAPGTAITSVLSGDSNPPWPTPLIVPDGVHLVLQGTSMSSPHVVGAVAMLMQKYPTMTPSLAKALLASGARTDFYTGAVPNPRWGSGRLDVGSLLCDDHALPVVNTLFPDAGDQLFQGTQVGLGWQASDDGGIQSVTLEYRIGVSGSWTLIASGEANDGYYVWTVPNINTDSLQVRVTAFDCVDQVFDLTPFVPVRPASVSVPNDDLPLVFAARHASPNPFSKSTLFGFDLPAGERRPVEVSVFNVAGRRVRTVVRGELPPGRYSYEWDGRDDGGAFATAGIYFLRVSAGQYSARDRLIFLP